MTQTVYNCMVIKPRYYQNDAMTQIRHSFRIGHKAPIYRAPTGAGKTVLFCMIAKNASARGTYIIIVVHRRELIRQASRALSSLGIPHGIIAPDQPYTAHLVQVASVQTLARRSRNHRADLLIMDEGHHATASQWLTIMAMYPDARVLGVSATPCRLSGAPLGTVYDDLILGPTERELMQHDPPYLSKYRCFSTGTVDTSGLKRIGGDFKRDDLNNLMNQRHITGDIIEHYVKYLNGQPTIVFCSSVDDAKATAEQFRAYGFRAEAIYGAMPQEQRDDFITGLGGGRLNLLMSCDLISEGVDIPVCIGAILKRPTASTSLHLQQLGRVLRVAPGKEHAIILDHVGNCIKHGLPDTPREWTLGEGLVRKKRETKDPDAAEVRRCPECYGVHDFASTCPYCGYVYERKAKKPLRVVSGQLKELTMEEAESIRSQCKSLKDFQSWAKLTGRTSQQAWGQWQSKKRHQRIATQTKGNQR